jgi:hypothetical protein
VNGSDDNEGVSGLKALGVRELTYKMAFLAFHVSPCNAKVCFAFACCCCFFKVLVSNNGDDDFLCFVIAVAAFVTCLSSLAEKISTWKSLTWKSLSKQ